MRKKSRTGGIRLPDLTLSYKSLVIKNNMVLAQKQKYKSMGQDRMSRKTNLHTYSQLFHDKRGKTIQWRKNSFFNKYFWEEWTATHKRYETNVLQYHKQKTKMD